MRDDQSADQFADADAEIESTSVDASVRLIGQPHGIRLLSDAFAGVSHCLVIRIFT
ncbi:hypothetical protein ABXK61_24380 [Burkholderia sola]|uniref:hypothetical protein n=1 Tax=Burkholderia TaxID=32008 RepID=UPI001AE7D874|nr:hypothetical protein [Burkholderia sp. AcTa6-5]MBP0716423.1 hypothetical protein [Burkholderia sp. AcTa6-5]